MDVDRYFERIGYHGPASVSSSTLVAIHRAHLTAIAYENLDIHLKRELSLDRERIYEKIVLGGRGGWCYEMNTLLGWALREIGFEVTTLGAAVGATSAADRQRMDHMALLVTLQESWLLDVGFGNAFLEPLALREGTHQQAYHTYRLRRDGQYWCFQNQIYGGVGFDFLLQPRTSAEFVTRCAWLQTSPQSTFVKLTTCYRMRADYSILSLRGAVLTIVDAHGKSEQILDSHDSYRDALTNTFGLNLSLDDIQQLWGSVWPAHLAWLASTSTHLAEDTP